MASLLPTRRGGPAEKQFKPSRLARLKNADIEPAETSMKKREYSPWPMYSNEEATAVSQVLLSNKVNYRSNGDIGRQFEKEFAQWVGTDHAIAVANGTVALDLAWVAMGIGHGDEVIVTPRTFIASASSIALAGATPIFADVDKESQNITPETVEPLISANTKAIVCVHMAGWPCEMDGMKELALEHDIKLVEDCAQAHGALYKGRPVGGLGDFASWSFCIDKIMTTGGEGGMVTLNDEQYWNKAWSFKDHGKDFHDDTTADKSRGFQYVQHSLGTNWRLTEMQSKIGLLQLEKMPEWHAKRTKNANRLRQRAQSLSAVRIPVLPDHIEHAWYKLDFFLKPEALKSGWDQIRIVNELRTLGVGCSYGGCSEIYREAAFTDRGLGPSGPLENAAELGRTNIMFQVHPTLQTDEIEQIADAIEFVIDSATR